MFVKHTTCTLLLIMLPWLGFGQSVVNTVHNLSVNGPGTITATSETEVCIFCHTPHNSSPRKPLWNREDPGSNYTLYNSSTIQASPGQPDGASILCLSCHDGTIALGSVLSRSEPITFNNGVTTMPVGPTNLSTDLSDDHPVSFLYDASLAAADNELIDPANLSGPVTLENDKLQCTACHDAHQDIYHDFLVASNQNSDLCLSCHQKSGWESASHKTSTATWNGSGSDPWPHTPYSTVSENGCENCHQPHTADGPVRILNYYREEDNCLVCHNGNVAATNVETDINKQWKHNVYPTTNVHDPEEGLPVQNEHVECVDCHNPHMTQAGSASAPAASAYIQGVPGIDTDGNAVTAIEYQYELCYKCHADSPEKPGTNIPRQIEQTNVRLEFDLSNPSFHPIEGAGQNNNVPSLISPYTESSIIYCTDCHASNNSSVSGPHGSDYFHLLKYNYETADNTPESYQAYELCYQCHDRNSIVNNTSSDFSRNVHQRHIVKEDTPCSVCHDAHGISNSQGNFTNNTHLINFDTSVVRASTGGDSRLEFIDNGDFAGECYLYCHGKNHKPKSYN